MLQKFSILYEYFFIRVEYGISILFDKSIFARMVADNVT